jgi:hypothetical protein
LAAFYPAGYFRKSLYRPDVIQRLLETGSIARALEAADNSLAPVSARVTVTDVLPPVVLITAPRGPEVRITQRELQVHAVARSTGRYPVKSMRLLLDGRPYQGAGGQKSIARQRAESQSEVHESWTLKLEPGRYRIAAKADSAVSTSMSDEITVVCETETTRLPKLYALIVGISTYPDQLALRFAARDAKAVASALARHCRPLFGHVETRLVTDHQATRIGVLEGFSWLKSQMTQRDVGVIFYSGHGAKDPEGVFYFLPVDGNPNELLVSAVSEDQIKRVVESVPGRLILLLDACHTGAIGGDRRKAVGGVADDLVRDLLTDDYGAVVMCSSTGREVSVERDEWQHGAFSKALIEAISGDADYNRDRTVYLNELDAYLSARVKELTQGRQHPVTQKPTTIRSFPISKH